MKFHIGCKVEEHTWRTGAQYTEQDHHGYRVRIELDGNSYWSNPIEKLQLALDIVDKLKEDDC